MLGWLRERLGGDREPELLTGSPGLVVVVEAFDPAEADSAALARSPRWRPDRPAVLRHHLVLPPDQVERAASMLAQDGYELRPSDRGPGCWEAVRVQVLDALHCAQERSRMAGLTQRLGGDAPGWDALQPEPG
ncbi:ribonuclease E inhibitor RraB [Umezawaea endophytica]|uniref:Ribonuclease E inhibitor RraB n=2 Tax=Umezawaea endophytica TaxID=1654476 RepID=A0A9X2VHD6_9PSEU|nr:ribonuclease E inhibitor RraB [Umezawaea endophytica]MCS7476502.1 ribonuclease E inhibitor RraB [Umezawaea endophytica]